MKRRIYSFINAFLFLNITSFAQIWPAATTNVVAHYGSYEESQTQFDHQHCGIDIAAPVGSVVKAIARGYIVTITQESSASGYAVTILEMLVDNNNHPTGYWIQYGHIQQNGIIPLYQLTPFNPYIDPTNNNTWVLVNANVAIAEISGTSHVSHPHTHINYFYDPGGPPYLALINPLDYLIPHDPAGVPPDIGPLYIKANGSTFLHNAVYRKVEIECQITDFQGTTSPRSAESLSESSCARGFRRTQYFNLNLAIQYQLDKFS